MTPKLLFADGTAFEGTSFGYEKSVSGEVVFATGMVGYPESFTDPSYRGQILVLTYPLVGNYGIGRPSYWWESARVQIKGLIVSTYIDTPSHPTAVMTLGAWLKKDKIPALEIKDTRLLTIKLREQGAMLGGISFDAKSMAFDDPNSRNLVAEVSAKKVQHQGQASRRSSMSGSRTPDASVGTSGKRIVLVDCGAKNNIRRALMSRGAAVTTVPWDFDIAASRLKYDGIVISNGPGDPKTVMRTVDNIKKLLDKNVPILGICLGHQLLTLAAGGDTKKLKFGHRSQNQPCLLVGTKRAYLTTQNHGYYVSKLPKNFKPWFTNANDGTNEGIIHSSRPFMSVQFHPEATPGPVESEWVFDYFLKRI